MLPILKGLHNLLYRCRFPAFWEVYRSEELETLRENYTVECIGFENAVRQVVIRAVKTTFTQISTKRLGSYLDLEGTVVLNHFHLRPQTLFPGSALESYVKTQGWTLDTASSVVCIPPNPDNQVEATIVQESVNLPRMPQSLEPVPFH